ncbi:MAG TPA: small ribosomal subunit Rsm22 family protein [Polyangiaceae bacterium]|nr:small ribosomal subunit Rsm22 family protein [Polyangiaceae bacterium]
MPSFSWLVRPLEVDFRARLDALGARSRLVTSVDPARLGAAVRALSDVYNHRGPTDGGVANAARAHLGARLAFSFPRDVPKGAAAVRELVGTGLVRLEGRPLRVLDLGAGLGAMTFGLARALAAAGCEGSLDVEYVDADPRALELACALARSTTEEPVRIAARATCSVAERPPPAGPFDVVLLGQVLSELDEGAPSEARQERHAALLAALFERLAPTGSLVVIEPALRERARHLQALRDAWVTTRGAVFAPCLHASPCPALGAPGDWCHEELATDLPSWLVPVARAAGLRWQGLSFSYLVLRRDGRTLREALPGARLRVVSDLLRSKGKSEVFVCGELPAGPGRERIRRLDRHASPANSAWERLGRGAVLPELAGLPRVAETSEISPLGEDRP